MGGQGGHAPPPLTFSEIVFGQGCFPGNSLLCYSPRHPKLFGPQHSSGTLFAVVICCLFQNKDLFEIFPFLSNNCRKTGKSVYCLPLFTRLGHWHGPKKKPAPNIKPFEKPDPKYRTGAKQKPDLIFRFEINKFTTENTIYFTTQNENF